MATKTFGELSGVRVCRSDGFGMDVRCLSPRDNKRDYKVQHQGDPIFIVDYASRIIRTCVVKTITYVGCGIYLMKCSEKGKNQDFIPTTNDFSSNNLTPFKDCITVRVDTDSSAYANAATTLDGAIKLLNHYMDRGNFASLVKGDKIYDVNTYNEKITELIIEHTVQLENRILPTVKFICNNKTEFVISKKLYDARVSAFSDFSFTFELNDYPCRSANHFVFISKKKAEEFLEKRKKAEEKKNVQKDNGTDTKLKDSKGNSLYIGDTVAYFNGAGSFLTISLGKIVNNSKKMLKIFDEDAKKSYIEHWEEINKSRIEKGLEPYELDYTDVGFKNVGTNKILKIKNYD